MYIPASSSTGRQHGSLGSSSDAQPVANAHGATVVMWLMSDTEALAFIAIIALMLAMAVVLVIA
jgi:hypothetical protein